MKDILTFITSNIAYFMIGFSVLYIISFVYDIAKGKSETYHLKYLLVSLIVIGIGIYCLINGIDIKTFIH